MTDREHFIATLQACYFGDKNALEKIVRIYDEKENIIKEVREKIKEKEPFYSDWYDKEIILFDEEDKKELLEILD